MRMLIKISYANLLFAKDADIAGIIRSLDGAQIVEIESHYPGPNKIRTKSGQEPLEIQFIPDDSIILPENTESDAAIQDLEKRIDDLVKERAGLCDERRALQDRIKELEKEERGETHEENL